MSDFTLTLQDELSKRTVQEEHWLLAVISSHNAFCSCGSWSEHLREISPSLRTQAASDRRCGTTDGEGDAGGDSAGGGEGEGIIDDALLADALAEAEEEEKAAG
uniref:ORF2 n=1 Tax=Lepus torque teno virus 1 TaxID=2716318 RepID=A0A6G7NNX7_9VIRU|nr:ORF2 [Lepus torque teno virus 1]